MAHPLDGVKVLDLCRVLAGPFAGRMLADLGADVVKVEPPEGDVSRQFGKRPESAYFRQQNAGKRSITVDLREPGGLRARRAGWPPRPTSCWRTSGPGSWPATGSAWSDLSALNPRLVMLSISGFGQDGPERDRASYAGVIHAETGVVARRRTPDGRAAARHRDLDGRHGDRAARRRRRARRAAPARRHRPRPARRHGDDRRHGVQRRLPAQRGRRRRRPRAAAGRRAATAGARRRRRRAPPQRPQRDHRRARRPGDRDGRVQVDLEVDQRALRRRRPDAARAPRSPRRSPPAARRGTTSTPASRPARSCSPRSTGRTWRGASCAPAPRRWRHRRWPTAAPSSRSTTPTAPTRSSGRRTASRPASPACGPARRARTSTTTRSSPTGSADRLGPRPARFDDLTLGRLMPRPRDARW